MRSHRVLATKVVFSIIFRAVAAVGAAAIKAAAFATGKGEGGEEDQEGVFHLSGVLLSWSGREPFALAIGPTPRRAGLFPKF